MPVIAQGRFSPNVARLRPSATIGVSSLAKRLSGEGRDIINLSAGEPDFATPSWISAAGIEAVQQGKTRYTPTPGMPELRQAVAGYLGAIAGRELDWQGVVVTAGAKQALFNTCFALVGPEDEVLIGAPYWTSYPEMVTLARAEPVPVAGSQSRDFLLTPEDLERALSPRTRALIIGSPSNPTGAVYELEQLAAIASWARDREIWLISDEIYRHICFELDGAPAPGLLSIPEETLGDYVVVNGVSKSFAMTGWRIGFSYSDAEVAGKMSALQSHITSNPAAPSQAAALAAFSQWEASEQDIGRMVEAFKRRRDLVTDLMTEELPDFGYVTPGGAFYLFFRVDSTFASGITGSEDFCTRVLEEVGVAVVPGVAFGDDRYVRLSFATSDDLLTDGIRRIARFVRGL